MRRGWLWLGAGALGGAAVTVPGNLPGLGVPTWHHNLSLVATLAGFTLGLWVARADPRRHLALGVALWTTLALVSGFVLLWMKQDLKAWDLKDWAKFWHVAWSWLALWAFLGHTWVNRVGLMRSLRVVTRRAAGTAAYWGPLVLVVVAVPLTWSRWGADALQDPQYIPLTLWTALAFVAVPYGLWLSGRVASVAWLARPPVQNFVSAWLLPMTVLANVSGFPILWFGTKDTSLKYVAKYWHTWPSIAMAVLIFAHTLHFWIGMRSHWRRGPPA